MFSEKVWYLGKVSLTYENKKSPKYTQESILETLGHTESKVSHLKDYESL